MRFVSMFLCFLTMTACSHTPSTPTPINRDVVLGPGQSAVVGEATISLRFDGVKGDSRCPGDAICIQGGDAVVDISVLTGQGRAQAYALHTGDMKPVTHEDLTIALVE